MIYRNKYGDLPGIGDFNDYICKRWVFGGYSGGHTALDVLAEVMHKLRNESGSEDAFAFDASWEELADRAGRAVANHPAPSVAVKGLPGEVGEVLELLKKHERDGKHPGKALLLELGDALHYLTVIAQAYGWSLNDVARANIDKLAARDEKKRRDAMSLAELREAGLL